ncbi:MAG: FAD-binding protein [Cyclobacteriaceae bacterium]
MEYSKKSAKDYFGNTKEEFDIVVVGFGAAGASAAIEAANAGAKVLVLDRGYGGGASALSGGVVYAGGGTPYQKAAGVEDSPENMFNYLKQEVVGVVSDKVLKKFCDGSVEMISWLEKQGVQYEASLCDYKTSYPTDQYYLYYSGNEKTWPYNENAHPAARGHRQVAKGMSSGAVFFGHLKNSALKKGITFKPLSYVESLNLNDGKVIGLKYRTMKPTIGHRFYSRLGGKLGNWAPPVGRFFSNRAQKIWNRKSQSREVSASSIILSAGGFMFNKEMVKTYGFAYRNVMPLGTIGDDGKGIMLGQSVGGNTDCMDRMTCWRFLSPPVAFMEGVSVGRNGNRIANEDLYGATFSESLIHNHKGEGFAVLDATSWKTAKEQAKTQTQPFQSAMLKYIFNLGYKKAGSLQELAKKAGINEQGLLDTVKAYNDGVENGQDPAHKAMNLSRPIENGPFYAIDITVDASPFFPAPGLTLGGLVTDDDTGAVKDKNGNLISGLYAAGRNAVGICSNSYVSGLSLADCIFSGRRAGKAAAMTKAE